MPPRVWRLRWTVALVGFIVLMFVAGIAVTGATHQIAWLCRSPEPLFGESARRYYEGKSEFNLKEMGFGVTDFGEVEREIAKRGGKGRPTATQSWATQIVPYINYSFDKYNRELPWDHPQNAQTFRGVIWTLINPEFRNPPYRDSRGYALNHYAGNTRIFDSDDPLTRLSKDGSSHVLLIGEVSGQFVPWGQPENSREPTRGFGTPEGFCGAGSDRGAQFVLKDGSVRLLDDGIDPRVLEQLSDPSDVEEPHSAPLTADLPDGWQLEPRQWRLQIEAMGRTPFEGKLSVPAAATADTAAGSLCLSGPFGKHGEIVPSFAVQGRKIEQ